MKQPLAVLESISLVFLRSIFVTLKILAKSKQEQ